MDASAPSTWPSLCMQCNQTLGRGTGRKSLRCSACNEMTYCSSACQAKHWPKHKKDCQLAKVYIDRNETRALAHRPIVALQRDFYSFVDAGRNDIIQFAPSLYRIAKRHIPITGEERCPFIFRLLISHDFSAPVDQLERRFGLERLQFYSRTEYTKKMQSSSSLDERIFLSDADVARRAPPNLVGGLIITLEWILLFQDDIVPRWNLVVIENPGEPPDWESEPDAQKQLFDFLRRRSQRS